MSLALLMLLACHREGERPVPPVPPVVEGPPTEPGAAITLDVVMASGDYPEECNVRLMVPDRPEGEDQLVGREQPCGPRRRWQGLEPGRDLVVVNGRTTLTRVEQVTLGPDEHLDLGPLEVDVGGQLRVQVFRSLEDEEEALDPDMGGLLVKVAGGEVRGFTDIDGVALIHGVPIGEVEISVADSGSTAQAVVEVERGELTEVTLELKPLPVRPVVGLRVKAVERGAEVYYVHPKGPAAGVIEVGDVLLTVEGTPLAGMAVRDVGPLLAGEAVGDTRHFEVLRGDQELILEVIPIPVTDL